MDNHPSCFQPGKLETVLVDWKQAQEKKLEVEVQQQQQQQEQEQDQDQDRVERDSPRCRLLYDPAVYTRLLMVCRSGFYEDLLIRHIKLSEIYFTISITLIYA